MPLSGRCLDAVWTLSGRCLDTVWTGSGLSRHLWELHKPGWLQLNLDDLLAMQRAALAGESLAERRRPSPLAIGCTPGPEAWCGTAARLPERSTRAAASWRTSTRPSSPTLTSSSSGAAYTGVRVCVLSESVRPWLGRRREGDLKTGRGKEQGNWECQSP